MEGRDAGRAVAATRMVTGADVNYGALTRNLIAYLKTLDGFDIHFRQRVTGLSRQPDGRWRVAVKDEASGATRPIDANFVFLGAGGGALPLLQKSGIPEAHGYAGFPVSGIWLRCDEPDGQPAPSRQGLRQGGRGSPPMSVPHLDTRVIDGKRSLLFGPYAGFSTKFLKHGSLLDLPLSIRPANIAAAAGGGARQPRPDRYLIGQVLQILGHRFAALRDFYPTARKPIGGCEVAGQRVQIIKKDPQRTAASWSSAPRSSRGRRLAGRAARRFAGRVDRRLDHASACSKAASPTGSRPRTGACG